MKKQKGKKRKNECKLMQVVAERQCRERGEEGPEFSIRILETELGVLQIFEFEAYKMAQDLISCTVSKFSNLLQSLNPIRSGINKWRDSELPILMPSECLCGTDNITYTI